ncbi:MAG: 16S rRNA (cytidine(1402)-2'-O)-methyltransferase [Pseudomonadota bacterium]
MTEAESSELFRRTTLEPGLHLVATPIGRARDITLRALDTLASADVLVAEDTRVLRRLMEIHGISRGGRPLFSYHDHNGAAQRPRLLGLLADGKSLAYACDAGTPLVADPGFQLARAALDAGHDVHAVPGPSAALAALSVAGMPTDRFFFAGFPPSAAGARRTWLQEVAAVDATLVVFEAGRRVAALLNEVADLGHAARRVALCRELTKRFEEIQRGRVCDIAQDTQDAAPKGEVVVVFEPPQRTEMSQADVVHALERALQSKPLKDAAAQVAAESGWRKRNIYQLGLELMGKRGG